MRRDLRRSGDDPGIALITAALALGAMVGGALWPPLVAVGFILLIVSVGLAVWLAG